MAIKKDTLDDLLAGRDPKAVFSKDGLFDELKKALAERVLNAELDDHLDNEAAAGSRLRRQDRVDVRARHDGSRDPGPSPGALRAGGVAGPDFDGHRRRARDRGRMAEPA